MLGSLVDLSDSSAQQEMFRDLWIFSNSRAGQELQVLHGGSVDGCHQLRASGVLFREEVPLPLSQLWLHFLPGDDVILLHGLLLRIREDLEMVPTPG